MPTCFVVIGPPRTGTSLVMGLMNRMGVHTGPSREGPNNPEYYEHPALWSLVQQKRSDIPNLLEEIREGHEKWAIKHPKLVNFWGRLRDYVDNPHFLVTRRDTMPTIRSAKLAVRRETGDYWRRRLAKHYEGAFDLIDERGYPYLEVKFERWFDSEEAEGQLQKLAEFVDSVVTPEARGFIDPNLRHYK